MQPIEKLAKKRKYTGREAGQLYVYQNMQSILNARGEAAANYVTQEKFNKIMESFPSEYDYKFMNMYAAAYKAILKIYNNRPHEAAAFHTGMELLINALKELKNSAELAKAIKEYKDARKPAPAEIEGMNLIYRLQQEIEQPKNKKIRLLLERAKHTKATAGKCASYYILIREIGFFQCSDGEKREKIHFRVNYKEMIAEAYYKGADFVEACLSEKIEDYSKAKPSNLKSHIDTALKELMQNPEHAIKSNQINLDIAFALNLLKCGDPRLNSGQWRPIAWYYQSPNHIEEIEVSEYDVISTLANGISKIKPDITKSGAIEHFKMFYPELFAALAANENGGILTRAQNALIDTFFDEVDEPDEEIETIEAAVSSLTGTIGAIALISFEILNGDELKHYTEKNTEYITKYWTAYNNICQMIEKVFDVTDFSYVFAVPEETIREKISEYTRRLYKVYGIIGGLYGDYGIEERNREAYKRRIKESFPLLSTNGLISISPKTYKKVKADISRRYRMMDLPFFENIHTVIQEVMNLEEAQNEADRKKRRNS